MGKRIGPLDLPWMARPSDVKRPAWRRFLSLFETGTRFWTSIDGNAMDFVIVRRPDALEVLMEHYGDKRLPWTEAKLNEAFVEYAWGPREFFDDPYKHAARRGKTWQFSEEPTPFPVFRWDPYQ